MDEGGTFHARSASWDRGSGIGALALSFPSLFGKLELGGEGGVIGMVSSETSSLRLKAGALL